MTVCVDSLLGVPYADANCQELARIVLELHGRTWRAPDAMLLDRCQDPLPATAPGWTEVELDQVLPLDVLLLGQGEDVTHMAVVIDEHDALHTAPATGSHRVPLRSLLRGACSAWRLDP